MFELKDLPSQETLEAFALQYRNPDVEGLHLWLMWGSSTNAMLSAFTDQLALHGLTQAKFFVLLLLLRNPSGLSIAALAEGVNVTSPTMTRIIDRMEAAGLCGRENDTLDRRAWVVRINPAGEAVMAQALPAHYAWVAGLMAHFDADDRAQIRRLMNKLSQATQAVSISAV
jgi:DNA-binding MarR family transcriptional regulator